MFAKKIGSSTLVVPIALTAFFLLLWSSSAGIFVGDDSLYMGAGTHMGLSGLIVYHDWAPLYSLWFRSLGFFCHDPVARYFLSWGVLVLLVALIPALFKTPAASLYTLIVLNLPIVTDGPFVGLFASCIVITGICWLLPKRWSYAETLASACVLSFIVAFSRPEYGYGVLIATAATILAVLIEPLGASFRTSDRSAPASRTPAWLLLTPTISFSAIVIFLLGRYPSHRSGMAFAQHVNIRAAIHGLIPAGPDCWRSNYAELRFGVDTAHNALNGSATLEQFFRANPRLFLAQILDNLTDPRAVFLLIFVLAVILLPWLRKSTTALRPASLFVLLLSLPPLAGSIVIFPHTHYAAILIPSLTIFALQLFNPQLWLQRVLPWILVPGVALLGYLSFVRPHTETLPVSFDRLNLLRIQCVRQWDQPASGTNPDVFSVTEIAPVYLNASRRLMSPYAFPTWGKFQSWATQTQPAWIAVDTPASSLYGYVPLAAQYGVTEAQIAAFLQNGLGYTPHPCSANAQLTVYTRDKR